MLIATDDHVQCVWRDSLIYIITGWSNSGNIPNVQIYDPANDTVLAGTSTPDNNDYKAFGASGVIIGDTIYYGGGARDIGNFEIQPKLRIGIINSNSPDSISWSFSTDSAVNIYRSGAAIFNNNPIWIGGAGNSYNYNGIEYGTGNGVNPLDNIVQYQTSSGQFSIDTGIGLNIMDLRGVVQIGTQYFIAGGMDTGQLVSNKLYRIEYIVPPGISEGIQKSAEFHLFPNPATTSFEIFVPSSKEDSKWYIYNSVGELISKGQMKESSSTIIIKRYPPGIYLIRVETVKGTRERQFIVAR